MNSWRPASSSCGASRPWRVVLPAEGDTALVQGDQPAVGDRDAVGVARQVGQHRLGAGEGPLGVDHPLALAQRRQPAREGRGVGQRRMLAEELQLPGVDALAAAPRGSGAGTAATAPAPAGRTPAGTQASVARRARARRRARCRARAGDASASSPRCAAPASTPMRAPRCFGSAAMVSSVSAATSNSMP